MYISDFAIDDFRSYHHAVVRFQPGVCVLLGANGQGKTNLVEALAYLSSFSSHRASADTALVRQPPSGEQPGGAVVRAKVHTGERERVLELEIVRGRANRARINRTSVPPRELLGIVRTIVFAPEDLTLVKGDPGDRRRFLDEVAAQLWPSHQRAVSQFDKLARQRGALLKQLSKDRKAGRSLDMATLEVFTDNFISAAVEVTAGRVRLLQALDPLARSYYTHVSDTSRTLRSTYEFSAVKPLSEVDVIANSTLADLLTADAEGFSARMKQAIQQVAEEEIWRGVNLVGPHRDDLALHLDHLPVKGYASHGESWSVALALKLACFELLGGPSVETLFGYVIEAEDTSVQAQDMPILILDDVFAELDATRREKLLDVVDKCEQVFITAAVAADVPEDIEGATYAVVLDSEGGSACEPIPRFDADRDGQNS